MGFTLTRKSSWVFKEKGTHLEIQVPSYEIKVWITFGLLHSTAGGAMIAAGPRATRGRFPQGRTDAIFVGSTLGIMITIFGVSLWIIIESFGAAGIMLG